MKPPFSKKNLYILFLVLPLTNIFAQLNTGNTVVPDNQNGVILSTNSLAEKAKCLSNTPNNSNQSIVKLSALNDSFTIITATDTENTSDCDESNTFIASASTAVEIYKYDFSQMFIDILLFSDMDLARKRII